MAPSLTRLACTLLLLLGSTVSATPQDVCSTGIYKTFLPILGNDSGVQKFCSSLPASNKLDRSKCPKQLKSYTYTTIKTFCGCVKDKCMKTVRCSYGKSQCPTSPCGKTCYDLKTDSKNCGSCGKKCGYGQKCKSGSCEDPRPTCPSTTPNSCKSSDGKTTKCVDFKTDENNCGGCNQACGSSQTCKDGSCKDPELTCPSDKPTLCQGNRELACTNLKTDPNNCGACKNKCTTDQTCVDSKCKDPEPTCPADKPNECTTQGGMGSSTTCVNFNTDPKNCGGCGTACATSETCDAASCKAPPLVCSGDTPDKCTNQAGQSFCTNKQTSNENCGSCGNACSTSAGQTCMNGLCQTPVPTCGVLGGFCRVDADCCGGNECNNGACEVPNPCPSQANPDQCPRSDSSLFCTNKLTDSNNCGSCGRQCDSATQECAFGNCCLVPGQACRSDTDCCSQACAGSFGGCQ